MSSIFRVIIILLCITPLVTNAQIFTPSGQSLDDLTSSGQRTYEIGGITVSGTKNLDKTAIKLLSGLAVGDKITIPGDDKIASAVKALWEQKLFNNVEITATKVEANKIFINIHIEELPRLSRFRFTGVTKGEADDIREDIGLYKERIVNDNLVKMTENKVKSFYVNKGFSNVKVNITQEPDSIFFNHILLTIAVDKGNKVRINTINIIGNKAFTDWQIRAKMKETKRKSNFNPFVEFDTLLVSSIVNIAKRDFILLRDNFFTYTSDNLRINITKSSKFIKSNYEEDKTLVITKYNERGFRDARIVRDTVVNNGKHLDITINLDEGNKYYFRNIYWVGNSKHSTKELNHVLGIKKGDVYNQSLLETRLFMNPNGKDISSLYMDDGYLFFQVNPVEVLVENDSIDIELRVYEGQQARINRVTLVGNTKTNDHVVMREIRTRPGQLFSRSDIIRTQRELAQLGYFNAETLNVNPKPDPVNGTVDVEYQVEEKSNDQIELSGGWGAGRIVGTLGISFNNFSTRGLLKPKSWDPLPSGDGQRLSIRAQSNGVFFRSYNFSFTEPWLGGKKPNALSVSAYRSLQTNGQTKYLKEDRIFVRNRETGEKIINPSRAHVRITGFSVGLGSRAKWPDDYFMRYLEVNYQLFEMEKWNQFVFSDGIANNIFLRTTFSRSSVDQPIYPRLGSDISLSVQVTPPFSAFTNLDYTDPELSDADKYKWIEYHKWKFTSTWYTKIIGDLVLKTKVGFGYLGSYNKNLGTAPLERFYLGGSGLTGFSLDGREIIALRGYDDQSVSPRTGASLINKYTLELRYPFSLNPSATIYALSFVEAGNTWTSFKNYNPIAVKRSAGVGIRIFLPMFGLLGLDYGWRFDNVNNMTNLGIEGAKRGQLHFTIGANLGEL